jgi:hypothetical protein
LYWIFFTYRYVCGLTSSARFMAFHRAR